MENRINPESSEANKKEALKGELHQELVQFNHDLEVKSVSSFHLFINLNQTIKKALDADLPDQALEACQQAFIAGQHIAMRSEAGNKLKSGLQGASYMTYYLLRSLQIINTKGETMNQDLVERNKRNQGKYAEHVLKNPRLAIKFYQSAYDYFKDHPNIDHRGNSLELLGSVAEQYFKMGDIKKGIETTDTVVTQFNESEQGKRIKEIDPTRYANWISIVMIRAATYTRNSGDPEIRARAKSWVVSAEHELHSSGTNQELLQDRLGQLEEAKKMLSS